MRWIKIAIVMIVVGVCLLFVILNMNTEERPIEIGDKIPDMTLELYGEGKRSLHTYTGDVIVLNVWASWCTPCIREMPAFTEVAKHYEDHPVSIITVNAQARELRAEDAIDFIKEQQITLPVFLDAEGKFLERLMISALPSTYILDENFVVVEKIRGEITQDKLIEQIELQL